jgi:hypothetical protein
LQVEGDEFVALLLVHALDRPILPVLGQDENNLVGRRALSGVVYEAEKFANVLLRALAAPLLTDFNIPCR